MYANTCSVASPSSSSSPSSSGPCSRVTPGRAGRAALPHRGGGRHAVDDRRGAATPATRARASGSSSRRNELDGHDDRPGPAPHAPVSAARADAALIIGSGRWPADRILELLRRPVDIDEYTEIRELWKAHSIAEDNRDLPGLISTLTEDCVYEVMGTGARWEGHDGAARFYTELLTAFPDIHFDLEYIVIGPQGVCEEARVTATHQGALARPRADRGTASSGGTPSSFPWDPAAAEVQGRDGLHRSRVSSAQTATADAGAASGGMISAGRRRSRRSRRHRRRPG